VRLFELNHFAEVLTNYPLNGPSIESQQFLEMMWAAINAEPRCDTDLLLKLPVYWTKVGLDHLIISPESFESEPAIIQPSSDTPGSVICSKIPGLLLVSQHSFPKARVEDLNSMPGLMRFTKALSERPRMCKTYFASTLSVVVKLASRGRRSLESYVSTALDHAQLDVC
jgi:hypothetical protein